MKKDELTQEDLLKIFVYDPVSGKLYKKRTGKEVTDVEFEATPKAYFTYKGKKYGIFIHLVCWILQYGSWPKQIVFHRDFNKRNNKVTNLMEVSARDNYQLLCAYNNLTKYCDIKQHHKFQDIYLVRYLAGGRLKSDKHEDYGFAKEASERMKNIYRRSIIKLGGIPPI